MVHRSLYLAIIEWGWVGYEEFCRSKRVLSTGAKVDNTLQDLQNSSYSTKAKFNNCFIIHSKYFLLLKLVSPVSSLFFRSPNITQPCPKVFLVNGSLICSGLHLWRHFDVIGSIIFGGLYFWRHWFNIWSTASVMVNYACGFNQSETGKYFEWII